MSIIISLIGASASVIVALLGAFLLNMNNNKLQLRKLKENHYILYIEALHRLASDSANKIFVHDYTYARDKLLIIANENVIKKIIEYEEKAVGKNNPLHDEYMTSVIKEIRKDLAIIDKDFPVVYLKK